MDDLLSSDDHDGRESRMVAGSIGAVAGAAAITGCVVGFRALSKHMKKLSPKSIEEWNDIDHYYEQYLGVASSEHDRAKEAVAGNIDNGVIQAALSKQTLNFDYWREELEKQPYGTWIGQSQELIGLILQYVEGARKSEKMLANFTLPRHFFLRELITWLVYSLACFKGKSQVDLEINQVERRVNYLEALEAQDIVRNKKALFWEQNVTMRMVLSQVAGTLRYTVLPEMKLMRQRRSAADRLLEVQIELQKAMKDCLFYLYRSVKDKKPEVQFVASKLRDSDQRLYGDYLQTGCGKLLKLLVSTPVISKMLVYRESQVEQNSGVLSAADENPFFAFVDEEKEDEMKANGENDPLCFARVPPELWKDIKSKRDGVGVRAINRFFREGPSGIYDQVNTEEMRVLLVRLHGYVFEMVRYLSLLKSLEVIASQGGDIFVYGIMSGRLRELMESMIAVLSAVKATSGRIERLLRKNYDDRIARREDPNRWDQNFRRSGGRRLQSALEKIMDIASDIKKETERVSLSDRLKALKENVDTFWTDSLSQLNRAEKLGVYQIPPQVKKDTQQGYQIFEGVDGKAPEIEYLQRRIEEGKDEWFDDEEETGQPASEITKQGPLSKRGKKVKSWTRRWFVLRGASLNYYETLESGDRKLKGTIPLQSAAVGHSKKELKPFCFAIQVPGRTFYIAAKDEEEEHDWISAVLQSVVHPLQLSESASRRSTVIDGHHSSASFPKTRTFSPSPRPLSPPMTASSSSLLTSSTSFAPLSSSMAPPSAAPLTPDAVTIPTPDQRSPPLRVKSPLSTAEQQTQKNFFLQQQHQQQILLQEHQQIQQQLQQQTPPPISRHNSVDLRQSTSTVNATSTPPTRSLSPEVAQRSSPQVIVVETADQEIKVGYLVKRGAVRKNWTNRYFVLQSNSLSYYRAPNEAAKGVIPITPETKISNFHEKKPFSFGLMESSQSAREYWLAAEDAKEQAAWMESIEKCIQQYQL